MPAPVLAWKHSLHIVLLVSVFSVTFSSWVAAIVGSGAALPGLAIGQEELAASWPRGMARTLDLFEKNKMMMK